MAEKNPPTQAELVQEFAARHAERLLLVALALNALPCDHPSVLALPQSLVASARVLAIKAIEDGIDTIGLLEAAPPVEV